jgi:hypothetical protein
VGMEVVNITSKEVYMRSTLSDASRRLGDTGQLKILLP